MIWGSMGARATPLSIAACAVAAATTGAKDLEQLSDQLKAISKAAYATSVGDMDSHNAAYANPLQD
ncbi:MAG: hypothetical protein RR317_03725, partial [Bilophila sp.]